MSDLAATNCGGCCNEGFGCNWVIILLLLCCCGGGNGFGFGNNCGNNDCGSIVWILVILCLCGGNSFC